MLTDPRSRQGILSRGKPNYMGNPAPPGAGRPPGQTGMFQATGAQKPLDPSQHPGQLRFDQEMLRRRLMDRINQLRL